MKASNGVPYLQMRTVGLHSTLGREMQEKKERSSLFQKHYDRQKGTFTADESSSLHISIMLRLPEKDFAFLSILTFTTIITVTGTSTAASLGFLTKVSTVSQILVIIITLTIHLLPGPCNSTFPLLNNNNNNNNNNNKFPHILLTYILLFFS